MNLHPKVRRLLGIQRELDGLVQRRNRQHRPLRDRDPTNELRLSLFLHVVRPAQVGHLKPKGVHLPLPLLGVRINPELEPVERLLDVSRACCHKLCRHPVCHGGRP